LHFRPHNNRTAQRINHVPALPISACTCRLPAALLLLSLALLFSISSLQLSCLLD
jgi:hypothetical protein